MRNVFPNDCKMLYPKKFSPCRKCCKILLSSSKSTVFCLFSNKVTMLFIKTSERLIKVQTNENVFNIFPTKLSPTNKKAMQMIKMINVWIMTARVSNQI